MLNIGMQNSHKFIISNSYRTLLLWICVALFTYLSYVKYLLVLLVVLSVREVSSFIESSIELDHYFQMVAASELGKGESPELNIASPLEASIESNQLTLGLMQAVLPMVKVTLPEVYCPLASKYRRYHCWKNGIPTNLFDTAVSYLRTTMGYLRGVKE